MKPSLSLPHCPGDDAMNRSVKAVVFDLGRVLMHIDFDAFPRTLGLHTEEERAPYRGPTGPVWKEYETGAVTTDAFLEKLFIIFGKRYSKEKILEGWNNIIVRDNEEIIPFVHEIQKKYTTAILSNTSASHWNKVMQISKIVPFIPHHFTSFGIGAMKPDPVVYGHVARTLRLEPQEILFIDDIKENIDGALLFGMHGIVFTNARQLEDDFLLFEKKYHLK